MKLFALIFISHLSSCLANLLVISIDGLAQSYMQYMRGSPLRTIREQNAWASKGVKPTFASLTFPNHWTMATGLVQESHGVVSNAYYDRKRNIPFDKDTRDPEFFGGEAIWTTAKKAGLSVAVIMWPGVAARKEKYNPDEIIGFNRTVSLQARISFTKHFMKTYDLVMMYWDQVDIVGHKDGPAGNGGQATMAIGEGLKTIWHHIEHDDLKDLNVLVVSDHGMAEVTQNVTVDLMVAQSGLDEDLAKAFTSAIASATATVVHIYFVSNAFKPEGSAYLFRHQMTKATGDTKGLEEAKNAMRTGNVPSSSKPIKWNNITFFLKKELPDRWFYRKSDMIGDLVLVADEGIFIESEMGNKSIVNNHGSKGAHGYDNDLESMRGILLAKGPAFKNHTKLDEVLDQASLYPLMCHCLGITPAPNNGSLDALKPILAESYIAPKPLPPPTPKKEIIFPPWDTSTTPNASPTITCICFYTYLITLLLNLVVLTRRAN